MSKIVTKKARFELEADGFSIPIRLRFPEN